MITNIAENINVVFKGARMLFITAFLQPTFYNFVAYFERHWVKLNPDLKKMKCTLLMQ